MNNKEIIKKKKKRILILIIVVSVILGASSLVYFICYSTKYQYRSFLKKIENYIDEKQLNVNCVVFERVFGKYNDNTGAIHFLDCCLIFIIQVFIGILSSGGVLLNIISLYSIKKIFAQIYSNRIF